MTVINRRAFTCDSQSRKNSKSPLKILAASQKLFYNRANLKISKHLKRALDRGVTITVANENFEDIEAAPEKPFGLKECFIVPRRLATHAAHCQRQAGYRACVGHDDLENIDSELHVNTLQDANYEKSNVTLHPADTLYRCDCPSC